MDEFFARQVAVLRRLVSDYHEGVLDLDALIQRIEGVSDILDVEAWKNAIFPVVLSMEQVNAVALDARRSLTEVDNALIENSLLELETLIVRFEHSA